MRQKYISTINIDSKDTLILLTPTLAQTDHLYFDLDTNFDTSDTNIDTNSDTKLRHSDISTSSWAPDEQIMTLTMSHP